MLALSASAAHGETIYKIVDEHGNVSYTQTPPAEIESAKQINVDAAPTPERIEAAKKRHERNQQAADLMEQTRKRREEIISEENRLKKERQKQAQQAKQQDSPAERDTYPYYYPAPPYRPIKPGPILPERPIQLPAR